MASIAVKNLEFLLQAKQLGGTLGRLREVPRLLSTGTPALDRMLGGGWRTGTLSELVGRRASGRTTVVVGTLAETIRRGQVAAFVDTFDRFDPRSAHEHGVDLGALLWVRGAPITVEMANPPVIDRAIKQAIRACDLILRAGGFGAVVLDLSDVPSRRLARVPSITWLRLAHDTEGRDTLCLLVGESSMGRSAMGVSVEMRREPSWTGTSPQSRRFAGFTNTFSVRAARSLTPQSDGPDVLLSRR